MEILKPKKKKKKERKKEIYIINTILLKMFYLEVEESLNIKEYRNEQLQWCFKINLVVLCAIIQRREKYRPNILEPSTDRQT